MGSVLDNDYPPSDTAGVSIKDRAAQELTALEGQAREVPASGSDAPPTAADAIQDAATRGGMLLLSQLVHGLFETLAPAWGVSETESALLAQVWVPVLDKYLPGWEDSPEALAALATVGVLGPRIGKPRKTAPIEGAGHVVPDGPRDSQASAQGGYKVKPPRPDNG